MTTDDADTAATERVTVTLLPKTARELEHLTSSTGMTRTDVINRAVSLYAFVDEHVTQRGHLLAVHRPDAGETQIVHVS